MSLLSRQGVLSQPTAFNPLSLTPAAWYTADTLGLSNGAAINSWADRGPGNRTLVPGSAPTFVTGALNGLPVARFVSGKMLHSTFTLNQPTTWFIVCKYDASDVGGAVFDGDIGYNALQLSSGSSLRAYAGSFVEVPTTPYAAHVYTVVFNGASSQGYRDGTLVASANMGAGNAGGIRLGQFHTGTAGFTGDIGELLVIASVLSATDRQAVHNYLKAKWGTP